MAGHLCQGLIILDWVQGVCRLCGSVQISGDHFFGIFSSFGLDTVVDVGCLAFELQVCTFFLSHQLMLFVLLLGTKFLLLVVGNGC